MSKKTAFILSILLLFASPGFAAPGDTTRVSVNSEGVQGNGSSGSLNSSISANGRYVAFDSYATNLVDGDTNGSSDVFVHDTNTGQTTRVSVNSEGIQGNGNSQYPSISDDGTYVAFFSLSSNFNPPLTGGIYVHNRKTGQTTRISNLRGYAPAISSSGRYVAFNSSDNYTNTNVYVHDRNTGQTTLVSVNSEGTPGNGRNEYASISGDGRYVSFWSDASNLVAGDTNNKSDIFVHDLTTGQTTSVSVNNSLLRYSGCSYNSSVSSDGRYVAFSANPVGYVMVYDRNTDQTTVISPKGSVPTISSSGRYVAFSSDHSYLVEGDTNFEYDIFVHDLNTQKTSRVSVSSSGTQSNSYSLFASISGNGGHIVFGSSANSLVTDDTNRMSDIFVHEQYIETIFNSYDSNRDCIIGDFELLAAIDNWARDNLGDFELLGIIDMWASVDAYCSFDTPEILGTFTGSYTIKVNNCSVPSQNSTYNATAVITINDQNGSSFSGSGTGSFSGYSFEEELTFSGTISDTGQVSGNTSHTFAGTGGEGTFTGQLNGNALTITNIGADTYGDTCNYVREFAVTR